ncbi:MAG: restriction endonuclease subunit S [Peptoniphilus harei]|uniref:restriction endonuclease subunit S n=1 Tax=Peptoniphilus harei TaxID=54005 RepID=UPI0028FEE6A3|nr:restriction endonuclease subunit S [Peptoniphilus harei]MDU1177260.1 restriction endonuclease subunit S [Peptoniphilus harei]MDU3086514.1 restriction endonuclease subunit S [Peptoniphilus harei]
MKGLKEIASRNNWDLKLISDVVFFQEGPGVRKHQYTSKGVKLLNVTNILDGKLDLDATDRYISKEEAYGKYKHFLVDEGDLLIACSGIQISYFDKKIAFVSSEHLPLCMNTSTMRFRTNNENELNIKYFYYFLKSNYFKKQLARQITGSAQLNFGPSHIKKMFIIIPEIEYQIKLAKILDIITKLIKIRKEQIQAYDDLIESVFLSTINSTKYEIIRIDDLVLEKPKRLSKNKASSISYFDISSIDNLRNVIKEERIITEVSDRPGRAKQILEKNDILLSNVRPNLKNIAYFDFNNTCLPIASTGFTILRADIKRINPRFLFYSVLTEEFTEKLLINSTGASYPAVKEEIVRDQTIKVPPIELQNKFADYVLKIEEEKKKLNSSLKKLEDLFDALMQDAFSGNLFKD